MKLFVTFILLIAVTYGQAQSTVPILERKISISLDKEALPSALSQISQEGKFSFSYNSSIISEDRTVTLSTKEKTVREILNEIFKGQMDYKEKGNHLILIKVIVKPSKSTATISIISGYVENASTHERMANVSVYEKKSITSAITNEFGFFKIKVEHKDELISIEISKKDFIDTIITIAPIANRYLNVAIRPVLKDTVAINEDGTVVKDTVKEELSLPYEGEPNIQNISNPIYHDIQISLLPFVGSNGKLSGNIINNYSINIFGGISRGTRQIELGFFLNYDRTNVQWMQIAGIGNLVGGDVTGLQASGFFNLNGGETKAAQLTGFSNVNFHNFTGVQLAGFSNINLESANGVQVAGLANLANGPSRGLQIAGGANIQTDHFIGTQIAGISNISTEHVSGSQISALFNFGKDVRGTQIGLFNYADSLGGVPIGLISYVHHGYHKLEVSADEVFYTNLAFRTGSPKFYNILLAGIKPEDLVDKSTVWTFGYGMGTTKRLFRWLGLNLDLTAQHVSKGGFTNELSLLNKAHAGLDFKFSRKLSLYGGVTLNGYLTNSAYSDYPILFTDFTPSLFTNHTYNNGTNLKMWFGAKVGVRFL